VWRQIKVDWESWNRRDLGQEDIVRLIPDGTGGARARSG
jgi:hypothetical protein